MPNALDDLLGRIPDASLRTAIRAQVATLRDTKDFGLVFERHLPENVRLLSHPIRRGVHVQERKTESDFTWTVRSVSNGVVALVDDEGNESARPEEDLVVVRGFGEPIYPGFRSVGQIERGRDKPFHSVINGENFYVLETLLYAFEAKVDCIYIDPPYNSGARDWKYNNDYVDGEDAYRHSKWLSFMEKRLQLAKRLLNPDESVLIVTVDEKEYLRLGLLLDQVFSGFRIQMVSITINPKGTVRPKEFARVDEFAFFVFLGSASVPNIQSGAEAVEIRWPYLRRSDLNSVRGSRPRQFYPIYVNRATSKIESIGEPLKKEQPLSDAPDYRGCAKVFPIREDGLEMEWGLSVGTLKKAIAGGFLRVTPGINANQEYTFSYLTGPSIKKIASGELIVTGERSDGSKIVILPAGRTSRPTTVWRDKAHDAGYYGTSLLRSLIPGRKFPFPKSLYAVEDSLRLFVKDKPEALIIDFFGGSGTTTHAVARLNKQDGGQRRSILVTNNEVSDDEAKALRSAGHFPGQPEWEAQGIFEHITMPRIKAAITGKTPEGDDIVGDYKFVDEFPMSEGFDENVEFFELIYLNHNNVARGKDFGAIAPLLWMKFGGLGPIIAKVVKPFAAPEGSNYAVLFDINFWQVFVEELRKRDDLRFACIVTDSIAQFQQVVAELPPTIGASMLYEDYLRNFEINSGTQQ